MAKTTKKTTKSTVKSKAVTKQDKTDINKIILSESVARKIHITFIESFSPEVKSSLNKYGLKLNINDNITNIEIDKSNKSELSFEQCINLCEYLNKQFKKSCKASCSLNEDDVIMSITINNKEVNIAVNS